MKQKRNHTHLLGLRPYMWLLTVLMSMTVLPTQASDWTRDDNYFHATPSSDYVQFEVLLCDLYGKNTYSKGGYIQAVSGNETHDLIYIEYAYDSDDSDSNPTAKVKAYVVNDGAMAWFHGGEKITRSNSSYTLSKWSSDTDYLTATIDYYYPANLAGKTWKIQYKYTHSNGDDYTICLNSSVTFPASLNVSAFDVSKYTCERTSPDKIKFTVPLLPRYNEKANDERGRFCTYDVIYTFTKQNGDRQSVSERIECETDEQKFKETTIPLSVGNPKQIDVYVSARQGMKDKTGEFWYTTSQYNNERYFKTVAQPTDLRVDYRQFDKVADLTWSQPVGDEYLKSTPYVFRMETDKEGEPLSGNSWSKRGTLANAQNMAALTYSDKGAMLGKYYKYLILNIPNDWINHGITSLTLNDVSDELISRLGGLTSDILDTEPQVEITDLEQDSTVTDKVRLTWKYSRVPVNGSTVKFQVLRKKPSDNGWAVLKSNIEAPANPSAGTVMELLDDDLKDVTTRYDYMVRLSIENDKYTFESDKITAGLLRGTMLREFEASKGAYEKVVNLTWRSDLAGTGNDTYRIYRRIAESGAEFQHIASPSEKSSIISFDDEKAFPGYCYEYKLEVYSGDVLQNTLYDVGFTQSSGRIRGRITYASETNSNVPVEDVRITLQSSDTGAGNIATGHSMRVDDASTGMQWKADSASMAKLFGPDKNFTVQMFVRPDSLLNAGAVIGEIPGEGRLVLGSMKNGEYDLALQKVSYVPVGSVLVDSVVVDSVLVDSVLVDSVKYEPPAATPLPTSTKTTNLSTLTGDYTAQNLETLTGELGGNYKISIADGAVVFLKDVTINGTNSTSYKWAGINCPGDATLVLEGNNTVKGFYDDYPGIHIAKGKTLTIKGTGSLTASSNGVGSFGAGIGGGWSIPCGNIVIEGGTITATGRQTASGIGGGRAASCGNIVIKGGTIKATGGNDASGIGSGSSAGCGNIVIEGGTITASGGILGAGIGGGRKGACGSITITYADKLTATKGQDASCSIGKGNNGTCGTVTIGRNVYPEGISESPYTVSVKYRYIYKYTYKYIYEDIYEDIYRYVYGTATNTGVTLSANTYSLLTLSRSGDNLQFQVDGGEVKTLTATKYKHLAPFSVGGADSVKTANAFRGYVTEVRVWNKVLTDKEKASYNDRVLSGTESGLALYWPLNEGLDRHAFDASYANNLPNGRHATVGNNITSSTIRPSKEQLSLYGLTDANGIYQISSIPFVGNGTTYTLTPTKGIHKFNPTTLSGYVAAQTLDGYNFSDESSFPVRGHVTYLNTDIPVDSVQFKIDGSLVQGENGPRMTDSDGAYEISVPIGSHRIEAFRQGHRLTGFPIEGGTWDFSKSETVNFVDSTLVNVTGRVNGGFSDKDAPIGFKQSVNRIGQATIKLSLGKESQCSFNYITDDHGNREYGTTDIPVVSASANIQSTAWRSGMKPNANGTTDNADTYYIYIKTDPQTGEFSAMLPPLKYKVESITFDGDKNPYNDATVFTQNLPMINASNAMKERMKSDTLSGSKEQYEYSAKMIRQYRSTPSIYVEQTGMGEKAFGERTVVVANNDLSNDTLEVLTLTPDSCIYRFGYPIFRQGNSYNMGIDVAEKYTNYDTGEEFTEIPRDARVHIVNDASSMTTVFGEKSEINGEEVAIGMPYKTYIIEVTPDQYGHVDYTFEAGVPNFADGHLLNMSVSAYIDGRTTLWKPRKNRNALDMIVLGSITTGTNFVTEGPGTVDMILRRPPGSTSVASMEEKTIRSYVKTHTNGVSNGSETGAYISEAPSFEFTKGSVMGIAVLTNSTIKTVLDQKIVGGDSWSDSWVNGSDTTYTVSTEMSTPTEMQYIDEHEAYEPEGGDTYIGRSTNLLFSQGRLLDIFKTSDGYAIDEQDGITVGQRYSTAFVYPQAYILNVLIPNWQKIIDARLAEGYIDADHTNAANCPRVEGEVRYYTKYKPGDPQYGKGNADLSYWKASDILAADGCPSYRMINGTGNKAEDEVQNAINQIKIWRERIADNEREKVDAINGGAKLIENFSFSSTRVSRSTSVSTSDIGGKTHSTNYMLNSESRFGAMFNEAGAYIIHNLSEGKNDELKKDTTITTSRTVAWTMSDADYRTALSVDVYESKSGWGPIFITRGGQTANPYEGETQTMFYEKGTKINEATMRVEVPQLKVKGSTEITDVPTGSQAEFTLELSNQSETDDVCIYSLAVQEGSNPNGAILSIDGNILSNGKEGRAIKLKGRETIYKTLVVTQGNKSTIDYKDIVLVLKSQEDITVSSAPVKLRVHFVPSSSPVDLAVDHTVLNEEYFFKNNGITAKMFNLNRQDSALQGLRLRYRRKGTDAWTLYGDKQWTTLEQLIGDDYIAMPDSSQIPRKVTFPADGVYELQAQTFGLYGSEEVTYESNIVEVVQDTHGPKLLGMVSPEDGNLMIANLNNMHLRFNEAFNGNALSHSGNFRIEGGLNNVVADKKRPYPDVAVQLNGSRISTDALYDLSSSDFACDLWFYRQGDGTIISLGTDDNLLSLSTKDGGKLQARVGTEEAVFDTGESLPKDKWMYMALNYKHKSADNPKSTISMLYVTADDSTPHYIGKNVQANDLNGHGKLSIGGNGMTGMVSGLSIWNNDATAQDLYNTRHNQRASYTPGLVGYWRMDEGHGTQITDVARSRNMYMPAESWYINNENRAAHLNGKKPMLVDISTFQPAKTDNFAYEMWFKGTEADNEGQTTLFSVMNGSTKVREKTDSLVQEVRIEPFLGLEDPIIFNLTNYCYMTTTTETGTAIGFDNGKLKLDLIANVKKEGREHYSDAYSETTSDSIVHSVTLSNKSYLDGNWHHIALNVRRGTSAVVYIDGEAVKVLAESSVPGISSRYLAVGGRLQGGDATSNHFVGDVDEIRIWNAALDGQLIGDRMYERMDNSYPGLKGYFPMESIHRTGQGNILTEFSLDNFGESTSRLAIDLSSADGASQAPTQAQNSPALKPGSTKLRLDDSEFDFTASDDEIYFTFPESSLPKMDGNDFTVTVSNIRDEHGNVSQPVSWQFHADFASVSWAEGSGDYRREFFKEWDDEDMEIDLNITNNTGTPQSYEVSGMPSWMTIDNPIGTINKDWGYITIHLGKNVPVGHHTEYLYVTDRLGIRRTLQFDLTVYGDVPDWTVNPSLYESTMTMTGQIYLEDKICEQEESMLAAFDDMGQCVGVCHPRYVSTRDAYFADMIIYGNSETDISSGESRLTFKMYDASTGIIHPIVELTLPDGTKQNELTYTPDAMIGSYDSPVEFRSTEDILQSVPLTRGWTWMSMYVQPESTVITDVLPKKSSELLKYQYVKSKTAFASAYKSNGQVSTNGTLETMEPGQMYKIQVSSATTLDIYGKPIDVTQREQTIRSGYNWIGSLSGTVLTPDEAFADLQPEVGDMVKSRKAYAIYGTRGTWEGLLESIVPGEGYVYHSKAAASKTFHYPKVNTTSYAKATRDVGVSPAKTTAGTSPAKATAGTSPAKATPGTSPAKGLSSVEGDCQSPALHYAPGDDSRFPDNMIMIAVVEKDGQPVEDAEVAAFIKGECRGSVGFKNGYYFLTIMGSAEEDRNATVELRVWHDGEEHIVENEKRFVSDAAYGTLEEAYVLNIGSNTGITNLSDDSSEDGDYFTLQGFKIGRKPTKAGVYIHNGKTITIKEKK